MTSLPVVGEMVDDLTDGPSSTIAAQGCVECGNGGGGNSVISGARLPVTAGVPATPPVTAAERAQVIHQAVPAATQRRTTIAVTETAEGIRIVSSSEKRLRPAQRALLKTNEIEGKGAGHAEVTGINTARDLKLNPTGTAASRPICTGCQQTLKQERVDALSPVKVKKEP
ncbi:hypothetical protein [Chitinimonas sp. JJ19]|uniref:hypothetical protein n=1 Tax=Chitinimonas sp. JJ19 TaxID=3109352 RepID=UPI0030018A09